MSSRIPNLANETTVVDADNDLLVIYNAQNDTTDKLKPINFPLSTPVQNAITAAVNSIYTSNAVTSAATLQPIVNGQSSTSRVTGLGESLTIDQETGVSFDGQSLRILIFDNGTARNITWNAKYRFTSVGAPKKTIPGKWLIVEFIKSTAVDKWDCTNCSYEVEYATGPAVTFEKSRVYGTIASPVTGNITATYTDANPGTCIIILHQDASEPTYPAAFVKISGTYDTAKVNRIYCVFLESGTVDYSISQPA